MKVLYHTDADGWCSGYFVSKAYGNTNPDDFIMIDYGMENDWFSRVEEDEKVVIVDFSLELEDMRKLLKKTKDVIWIDHHISAIEKYKGFEVDIPGLRYNGIAGCVLTYCYFFEMNKGEISFDPESMPQKAPWFCKYIGDHDVWKYEFGEDTAHWKLGFDAVGIILPTSEAKWNELYNIEKVKEIISNGVIIEKYRNAIGSRARNQYGFEYRLGELNIFCLNNCFGGSEWFGELVKKYDAVCPFLYIGKEKIWEYSLYSDKEYVDCSKVLQNINDPGKISAGGHKGAAGLTSRNFIFK